MRERGILIALIELFQNSNSINGELEMENGEFDLDVRCYMGFWKCFQPVIFIQQTKKG